MSLNDFNQLQNIITGFYALVIIFSPLKKSGLAVGLLVVSALMGLVQG